MMNRNIKEYKDLPNIMKKIWTKEEYAWLSDEEKVILEETVCLPDEERFGD